MAWASTERGEAPVFAVSGGGKWRRPRIVYPGRRAARVAVGYDRRRRADLERIADFRQVREHLRGRLVAIRRVFLPSA